MEWILTAAAAFIGTNIDDLLIDALYFAPLTTRREEGLAAAGKYLGMGTLVLLSCLGAFGLQAVPPIFLRLLGIVPILMGLRGLWQLRRTPADNADETVPASGQGILLSLAAVTIANGGDNIGVYVPLFAGASLPELAVVCAVFAVMTGVWCLLGRALTHLPGVQSLICRHKAWLVPAVYILLGMYILCF